MRVISSTSKRFTRTSRMITDYDSCRGDCFFSTSMEDFECPPCRNGQDFGGDGVEISILVAARICPLSLIPIGVVSNELFSVTSESWIQGSRQITLSQQHKPLRLDESACR